MLEPIPIKVGKKLLEKDIEDAVCRYARSKGFMALKFTSPNRRSVPDRIILGPDRAVWFIEFKRKGAKPTAAQEREHCKLRQMGFVVHVVDDIDRGKRLIDYESS